MLCIFEQFRCASRAQLMDLLLASDPPQRIALCLLPKGLPVWKSRARVRRLHKAAVLERRCCCQLSGRLEEIFLRKARYEFIEQTNFNKRWRDRGRQRYFSAGSCEVPAICHCETSRTDHWWFWETRLGAGSRRHCPPVRSAEPLHRHLNYRGNARDVIFQR